MIGQYGDKAKIFYAKPKSIPSNTHPKLKFFFYNKSFVSDIFDSANISDNRLHSVVQSFTIPKLHLKTKLFANKQKMSVK